MMEDVQWAGRAASQPYNMLTHRYTAFSLTFETWTMWQVGDMTVSSADALTLDGLFARHDKFEDNEKTIRRHKRRCSGNNKACSR